MGVPFNTKTTGTGHTSNWAGAAIGAGVGLIGMLGQKKREKRAVQNQKTLMDWQMKNQKHLNEQGHELQMKAWRDTNYPAQMAMMREAGLNPGLMYGMSGGGGTTTGSQGGGGAAGGQAPAPQPMELGTALNAAMTQANIELAKSQAEKNKAEAASITGSEGTVGASQIESNLAGALNQRVQAELNRIGVEIGKATMQDQIDMAHYNVERIIKENNLTDEEAEKVKAETAAIGVKMQLDRANIELSEQKAKNLANDIILGWKKLDAVLVGLMIDNNANKLRALEGQTAIQKLQNDFILGTLGKEIDLQRLNIEQQKVFVSIFNGILGSMPKTSTTKTHSVDNKGVEKYIETKRSN